MVHKPLLVEPLRFRPLLKEKIWGGDGLFRLLGKGNPSDARMGESWELSDNSQGESVVVGGLFDGENFRGLFQNRRADILGAQNANPADRFPLLYKFIYADDNLSVQVHPGNNSPWGDAKTECWYIVNAPEGAALIAGLKEAENHESVLETLQGKNCRELLHTVPVKTGDLVFIPAGTVHAITPGILIYEVQQNSDTTFRLYDWDRLDEKGMPRPLHLREASEVLDFTSHNLHKIEPISVKTNNHRLDYLVACPYFALVKYSECVEAVSMPARDGFTVLTCVKGEFRLSSHATRDMPMAMGDTLLIPASCKNAVISDGKEGQSEIIASFVPDLRRDIVNPLKSQGHGAKAIRNLGGYYGIGLEDLP